MERSASTTSPVFEPRPAGTAESLGSPKVMDIILQRHGEKGPDGWLTPKGIQEVQ